MTVIIHAFKETETDSNHGSITKFCLAVVLCPVCASHPGYSPSLCGYCFNLGL